MKNFLKISAAATSLLIAMSAAQADEQVWRFFVGDHEKAQITVVEAGKDPIVWDQLTQPARLAKNEDGQYVFAVQRDNGRVDFARSGFFTEDHGDHSDLKVTDPEWQGLFVTGAKPTHFVIHGHEVAAFMDGTGSVAKIDLEKAVDAYPLSYSVSAKAHHGVAVPLHGKLLITAPTIDSESSLPDHVQALDAENKQIGDLHECKGLHGEAASQSKIAFACVDGIRVFDENDLSTSQFFAYPEALGEGRSGRLDGGKTLQYFAGNFGKDKMIFIDVEGEGSFVQLQFDAPLVSGYFDPVNSGQGFAHTADGKLHKIDTLSATIVASAQVTEPVDMEAPWYSARPNFTFAGDKVALVEPNKSVLKLISKSDLSIAEEIAVEGKPYQIVAIGGELSDH